MRIQSGKGTFASCEQTACFFPVTSASLSLSFSLSCDDDDDDDDGASTEFLPAEVERSVIRVEKSMVDRVFLLPSTCCPRRSLA